MQDDVRFSKIVKRITKLNVKYLKVYNTMIFNICDNNLEVARLDNNLQNLKSKLDFNKMLLSRIMREYFNQKSSIDEIKTQLLYYVNNIVIIDKQDKENQAYTRKLLNYLFRK